ncbi:cytosine/adenosine deaminase-related metal-dependent hydrolase [Ancylobacter sp. 3268]|uniref:8-oxoguanine deaminase n=1 Tax=Ancylobacter sp. 3268 TaxID=2817752 RepID=UPI0028561042|nr:8-oxoguanine deaminase [Ancylobacter sp. 3268]MDR6953573.1 cytosine/adenosine deaminase-related metal-dependent hydrolase [Ancylobacter sp. 3268]
MATLLAKNATVLVTMDGARREISGGGLFARDGRIEAVGPSETLPATADRVIDLSGHVVLPGLVNGHHHLDQTLTRNLPAAQNTNLFRWLKAHYRIWGARTPEASRTATLVGLAELALSGCTTAFDHAYVFRNGCKVDDQIGAAREIGMRFMVSRGSMSLGESRGGLPPDSCVEDEDDILADSERVIGAYHDAAPGAMLQIALAPCSPFSVSPELMRESASLARRHKVRLHTHLAETVDEERYTLERFGKRPVAYMEGLGWLGDDVWFAHAVHVNAHEIGCFAGSGVGVCHCPSSNMRLASGIAPVKAYRRAGVKVGLGVDGSASNDGNHMLGEARQAMLLARLQISLRPPEGPDTALSTSDPSRDAEWMTAREALELATLGGAAVLGRNDIGSLQPGRCADFTAFRLDDLAFAGGLSDPVAACLFTGPHRANWTVVNGRPVVEGGEIVTIDLPAVIAEHNRHAARLAALHFE